MPAAITDYEAHFWTKVRRDPEGCWEWTGGFFHDGYGYVHYRSIRSAAIRAHRFAYELVNGPVPEGLHVLHTCDNRKCCRPSHLWAGTNLENIQDRMKKNRSARCPGSLCAAAKLHESDVLEMRRLHATGISQRAIGKRFNVSPATAHNAITGKKWAHLR